MVILLDKSVLLPRCQYTAQFVTLFKVGEKWVISETSSEDKWPEEISIRHAEKPLPYLSVSTVSIYLFFFPPASHFIFLLPITLLKYLWGLWCMKDAMWRAHALDQRCPFGSCFALIVLSALCLLLHLFHLSGCWKVAFSLKFFFPANFSLFYYKYIVQESD